jgi:RNA polymerase sigma-70 factor (ECF subfamily)
MIDTDGPAQKLLRDQFLVLRCQAGDQRAFAELFDRFHERTRLYLLRLLGRTEAEDVQQEVWLGVYRRISGLANPAAFRTWLFQVTRNQAVDFLRKRRRHEELLSSVAQTPEKNDPTTEDDLLNRVDAGIVDEAVQGLTAPLRETVHLRYWEDLSYSEIALVTGQPIGTVRSRLHHARKRLSRALGPFDDRHTRMRANQDMGASG